MKTPILETDRLLLRPMTVQDTEMAFSRWTSDPEVARFMRWPRHETMAQTQAWLTAEEALLESDAFYNWGFVWKATGELIGSGGLAFNEDQNMFELGYNLMQKYWNCGLATEASRRILQFARQELDQTQIFCCHAISNPASGRVIEKLGFQYQGDGAYSSYDLRRTFPSREYLLTLP